MAMHEASTRSQWTLTVPDEDAAVAPETHSELPDVQDALRATEGVAHARVVWPDPLGPAHLTITFEDTADQPVVTRQVLEVLERVGGVDLDTLEVIFGDAPDEQVAAPASPGPEPTATREAASRSSRGERPAFHALSLERGMLDTAVEVVLHSGGEAVTGRAVGFSSERQTPRIAAEATLEALRATLPGTVRLQLDWVEVTEPRGARPGLAHVAVLSLGPEGEESHVGSAIVRQDAREAAVRATLDATNRRLTRLRSLPGVPSR